MMIALLAIMLVLAVRSVTLNGAVEGIKFYLLPDFSKMVDSGFGEVVFAAIGQAFLHLKSWELELLRFGSYIDKKEDLQVRTIQLIVGYNCA